MASHDHDSGSIAWPPALQRVKPSKRAGKQAFRAHEPRTARTNGKVRASVSRADCVSRERNGSVPSRVSSVVPSLESGLSERGSGRAVTVEDEVEECVLPEDQVTHEARPPTNDRFPRTSDARSWSPQAADPDFEPEPRRSDEETASKSVDPPNTCDSPTAASEAASPVRPTVTLRARFRSNDSTNQQPGSGHEGFIQLDVEHLVDLLQRKGHLEPRPAATILENGKASGRSSTPYHYHYLSSSSSSKPRPPLPEQPVPSPSPSSFAPPPAQSSRRHRAAYTPCPAFSPPPTYTSCSSTVRDRNSRSWLLKTEQRPARGGDKIAVKLPHGAGCWMRHREPKGRRMEASAGKRR
nr:hypothetical protein CFP56_09324 [Quercus suber]